MRRGKRKRWSAGFVAESAARLGAQVWNGFPGNEKPRSEPGLFVAAYFLVAFQAIAWTVWETRATGADVDAAGAVTAGVDVPRVSRWTKWYGGQGPDTCIWQSRRVALVVANLF